MRQVVKLGARFGGVSETTFELRWRQIAEGGVTSVVVVGVVEEVTDASASIGTIVVLA